MSQFTYSGKRYLALTMRANTILARCKDLVYLSFFGEMNRNNEILALLADVANECVVTNN